MEGKSSVDTKKRRKHLRAVRKRYIDKNTETEGVTYAAGPFSQICKVTEMIFFKNFY